MSPEQIKDHLSERLKEGVQPICVMLLNGRSTMIKVMSVSEDGIAEYEILGRCPRMIGFN